MVWARLSRLSACRALGLFAGRRLTGSSDRTKTSGSESFRVVGDLQVPRVRHFMPSRSPLEENAPGEEVYLIIGRGFAPLSYCPSV
jgi:hypothetical protein